MLPPTILILNSFPEAGYRWPGEKSLIFYLIARSKTGAAKERTSYLPPAKPPNNPTEDQSDKNLIFCFYTHTKSQSEQTEFPIEQSLKHGNACKITELSSTEISRKHILKVKAELQNGEDGNQPKFKFQSLKMLTLLRFLMWF